MTTPQSPLFNEHPLNAILIEASITQPENIPATYRAALDASPLRNNNSPTTNSA